MMIGFLVSFASSLENGLAVTPPMGWMHWEQFRCVTDCTKYPDTCISENLFVDMIDHLADDGWLEYGYAYVDIDDCWMAGRDEYGNLYPDPDRFPHGIKWLADYAHQKGVKLGIYNDYGTKTCGGFTGSEGYLLKDARLFASWGVDKLKMDGCYSHIEDQRDAYPAMTHFLNQTGRKILYSCSWPAYDLSMDYAPLPEFCNMWRNWDDIHCTWKSIKSIIDKWGDTPLWANYAGPGHWNDPDMLMIGMTVTSSEQGITHYEERSQFAIWAILAAPLIMSNDLRKIPEQSKAILRNRNIIEVSQDKFGKQGYRVTAKGVTGEVWVRQLDGGEYALALLNAADSPQSITATFSDFAQLKSFRIKDLWDGVDLGTFTGSFSINNIQSHDTMIYRLIPMDE